MRDAMPAAEVDALRIHVEHAVPGARLGLQDRGIVRRHDPSVVVEHIDPAVALRRGGVHRLDTGRIGDVDLLEERLSAGSRRLLTGLGADVRDAYRRPFRGEQERGLPPDPAGGAGDDDDLAVEPAHQSVETNTFLTSE